MRTRILFPLAALAQLAATAQVYTNVAIPTTNNIQTALINTIPTGTFTANNSLATQFKISAAVGNCGPGGASPCNYYDGFTGSGKSITMAVNVAVAPLVVPVTPEMVGGVKVALASGA